MNGKKGVYCIAEHGHLNRLINEKSPYLLQHAMIRLTGIHGEEAFQELSK